MWRIARDSEVLDLNSSYSYLLWCRDFSATSLVARDLDGEPIAFVTGYARPDRPQTLVVWQIAVDREHRGRGLAGTLLDALTSRVAGDLGIRELETTVTPDNTASDRLFTAYAERHGARLEREVLFEGALFPRTPRESANAGDPERAGNPAPVDSAADLTDHADHANSGRTNSGRTNADRANSDRANSGRTNADRANSGRTGPGSTDHADRTGSAGHPVPGEDAHQPEVLYRISPISA